MFKYQLPRGKYGPQVLRDEMHVAVEFGDATGAMPSAEPICVIRKPPFSSGM